MGGENTEKSTNSTALDWQRPSGNTPKQNGFLGARQFTSMPLEVSSDAKFLHTRIAAQCRSNLSLAHARTQLCHFHGLKDTARHSLYYNILNEGFKRSIQLFYASLEPLFPNFLTDSRYYVVVGRTTVFLFANQP